MRCFAILALVALAQGGTAVLGPLVAIFMVKFAIPAVVLGLLALVFFRLILSGADDDH